MFVADALLDVLLGFALGLGLATRRSGPAGAAVIGWLLKLAVLRAAGLDPGFGAMHVAWNSVVFGLPSVGAGLAVNRRARPYALGGALLIAGLGLYGGAVEPERLVVERHLVRIPAERAGDRPVRIAVLADLQFERVGEHERGAVATAMAQRPDVVLLPGDVHQGDGRTFAQELPRIRALLRPLSKAPGGAYFVLGDQEQLSEGRAVVEGTGVRLLADELVRIRVADRRITLVGTELNVRSPAALDALSWQELPDEDDIRISLAHRPDAALQLPPRPRTDLVVAGHTHGGQIQLPFVGPPVTFTDVPRAVAAGGLHHLPNGARIYVSRGIGAERGQAPRVRIGAPPEVSLLTLTG